MRLHHLLKSPGARKRPKRLGRGTGSGFGKTSGRGQKGQKSRSGVSLNGFEGGQNPIYRRLPKRGFCNIFATKVQNIGLKDLQHAIDRGKIDAKALITPEVLLEARLIRKGYDVVKVLGNDTLKQPIKINVHRYSKAAKQALTQAQCDASVMSV